MRISMGQDQPKTINSGAGGGDHPRLPHNGLSMEVHQVQKQPPTAYENRLGDAIEDAFRNGIREMPALVADLNAKGVPDPKGAPWKVETFESTLAALNA
jgi:hypothetical protein